MRNALILAAAILLSPALPTMSSAQTAIATEAGTSADKQAINAIHERWAGLLQAKDAAAIEQLYADNAVLLAPGEAAVIGNAAIGARWTRQLQLKDLAFSLHPEQVVVSASGDLAHDRGTYDFAATLPQGPITDKGKYVLVWQKIRGQWKVIADIFNSNPTPPAN
ncbi:nuclear transport factor 2 family protein [Rhizobium sp. CNPSo 3464]|uniref:YybH family protein n=1 Tax=Rhizobium sp. CNPSo 3464 TaxID=3021406 RepID=UPI002549C848|nr:nuclear transport factor 2 family protein [Rhizobium sp. CNPSo 3464]MDK4740242.1 nuclear transport factor 2 family protein [Rhizobium sp. CNPSo 3464]